MCTTSYTTGYIIILLHKGTDSGESQVAALETALSNRPDRNLEKLHRGSMGDCETNSTPKCKKNTLLGIPVVSRSISPGWLPPQSYRSRVSPTFHTLHLVAPIPLTVPDALSLLEQISMLSGTICGHWCSECIIFCLCHQNRIRHSLQSRRPDTLYISNLAQRTMLTLII